MAKPKRKPPDDPEQSRRFIEKAKEVEADETGRTFDKVITPSVLDTKNPPPKKSGGQPAKG